MEFGIGRGQIITCAPHPSPVLLHLIFFSSTSRFSLSLSLFFSLLSYSIFSLFFPVVSLSLKQSNMQIFNEMIISLRSSMGGRTTWRTRASDGLFQPVCGVQSNSNDLVYTPLSFAGAGTIYSRPDIYIYVFFLLFPWLVVLLCVFQKILKNMNMETKKKHGSGINLNNDGWFILNYSNADQLEGIMQVNGLIRERWWYYSKKEKNKGVKEKDPKQTEREREKLHPDDWNWIVLLFAVSLFFFFCRFSRRSR